MLGVSACATDDLRKRGQHRATRAGARVGSPNSGSGAARARHRILQGESVRRRAGGAPASRVDGTRRTASRRSISASPPKRRTILPAARTAYESYLEVGKTRGVKNQIAERLAVSRAKSTSPKPSARSRRSSSCPQSPVRRAPSAVMPFTFSGSDTSLKPLERGFAELVATDLSRSPQLTVVERERLQALLDEMRSAAAGGATAEACGSRRKFFRPGDSSAEASLQLGSRSASRERIRDERADRADAGHGARPTSSRSISCSRSRRTSCFGCSPTWASRSRPPSETRSSSGRRGRSPRSWRTVTDSRRQDAARFDEAAGCYDNAVRLDPSFRPAQQRGQETKNIVAGKQRDGELDRVGLRGTAEGAVASSRRSDECEHGGVGTADGLNPSIAAGATGGGVGTPTQPAKDPSSGTGGDNVTTKTAQGHDRDPSAEAVTPNARADRCSFALACAARRSALSPCSTSARASRRNFTRTRRRAVEHSRSASSRFRCSSSVPLTPAFTFDVGTSYARSHVEQTVLGKTTTSEISGLTDTQIRGHYVIGTDFVVLTAGVNLPTGQSTIAESTAGRRESRSAAIFSHSRSRTWEPALAARAVSRSRGRSAMESRRRRERASLGAIRSVRRRRRRRRCTTNPGNEYRARVGVDRPVGTGRATLGVTYSTFGNDDSPARSTTPAIAISRRRLRTTRLGAGRSRSRVESVPHGRHARRRDGARPREHRERGAVVRCARRVGAIEPNVEGRTWTQPGSSTSLMGTFGVRCSWRWRLAVMPSVGFSVGRLAAQDNAVNTTAALTGFHATLAVRLR